MSSSLLNLPQELIDQIIDEVGPNDKRTMASCILTGSSWTPRSSKHFLATVHLFTPQLQEFLTQAKSSCRLRHNIVEFSVSQPLHGHDGFDLTPFVHDILATLPNLQTLSISGERISVRSGLDTGSRCAPRRDLSVLRLSRLHVEALPELLELFDHIDTLHIDEAYIPASTISGASTHHLHVSTLHFDGSLSGLVSLRGTLDASSLRTLCLKCDGHFRIDTAPVNALIQSAGRFLEHFRLDLPLDGWVTAGSGTCLSCTLE